MEYNKIRLTRLVKEDIELVRKWRNNERIREYMSFREHISREMQIKWFDSVNNDNNLFYIIWYDSERIGLVNIKNIDWVCQTGESGLFIFSENFQNSLLPYVVTIQVFNECFTSLGFTSIQAHILNTNKRAIRFNKSLGFELIESQENIENQLYVLTKENYELYSAKIEDLLKKSMVIDS